MARAYHKQALRVGHELKGYRLVDVLGVGGFGVTYLAQDAKLERRIAIKEYLPNEFAVREGTTIYPKSESDREDFEWGLARFLDEARTLARFKHPNLVRVVEYFEANSTAYIVMDYEEGESLDRLLDRHGTLSESQLRRILLPIVEGLRKVHAAGYLHRDIKPSNVYVRRSDESPVLLDFGAARQALGQKSKSLTAVASAGYSPPEQYESEGEQGPWTDIYALSALCYQAITGDPPIEAPRRQSRLARGQPDPLPALVEAAPEGYAAPLLAAVDEGLRVIETERPGNLDEWLARMQGTGVDEKESNSPPLAELSGQAAESKRTRSKGPWLVGAAVTAVVIVLGYWFAPWNEYLGSKPQPDDAQPPQEKPAMAGEESGPFPTGGGSAILVVETDPPGAEVLLSDEVVGTTPFERSDMRAGTYTVTLRHANYQTVQLEDQALADGVVLRIDQALMPGTGRLTVLTDPRDVWVERDGERLARGTPVTLEGLPAGTLALTLGADEHRSIRVEAEVPKDGVGRLERTLERIPYGTLTLELVPEDAEVTLPDVSSVYLPGVRLPEGEHQVVVSRTGYRSLTRTIVVAGHTQERIALLLNPQPFTIETTPPEATVSFVGYSENYRDGILLEPGEYRVRVSADSYETQEVMVRHGPEPTRYNVVLTWKLEAGSVFTERLSSGTNGPEMVVIPVGSFRMGCVSGLDCFDSEKPVHTVTILQSFAVSKHEITFSDWEACVSGGGCNGYRPEDRGWGRGTLPVINVSWDDAKEYVAWLSSQTGQPYRLLTEAEWEYAARAGSSTRYSWGDEIGRNRANCGSCGGRWDGSQTAPVGSFAANAFGLHDMHGNVWEWVEDCRNENYTGAPSNGSAWLTGDCEHRVLRGGSWNYSPWFLRSAYRLRYTSGNRYSYLGFRVARALTP